MNGQANHAALLIVLFSSAVCSHAEPARGTDPLPGEMLPNRSFEDDGNNDGRPDGWSFNSFGTTATAELDSEVAHTGTRSLRIAGAARARAGAHIAFAEDRTDATALYLLAAWVKVDGTTNADLGTSARLTSVGSKAEVLKSDYRLCAKGPHDWRRYEWSVDLPEGTTRFNLVLFHHGEGTAWWDDVSLRQLRPVAASAPKQDASVSDGKPVFRWEGASGKGTLAVSSDPAFAPASTAEYKVQGNSFAVPDPLPTGKTYYWRVIAQSPNGEVTMSVQKPTDDQPAETSRFYAGTWAQRSAGLRERVAQREAVLRRLQEVAKRNDMWDDFSLLGDAIAQAKDLIANEPAEPGKVLRELDDAWAELDYTQPWWETIFLDDAALFAGLNLDLPGLEATKAAVGKRDWMAARAELLAYFRAREKPSWYGRHEGLRLRKPTGRRDKTADQYLTHKHPIHDYKEPTFDLGRDLNWHVFPIIDVEWPTSLHRHFHWSKLASAYTQTGVPDYAAEVRQQLLDWAKDNPMERWDRHRYRWAWSTLNATIRIYSSWINAWLQIRQSPEWTPDAQFVFLTCLREHGRFLMTHAAKTGNWVVAEARGLVELGIMFPEFMEAEAWRNEGFRRLQHELTIQVLEDGIHIERTPGYHSMTMSCFMEPVRLAGLNGVDVPGFDDFVAKMDQMHEYYLYGAKPNHRMAQIGDAGPMNVDKLLNRGYDMFRRLDMQYVLTDGKEGKPPVHRSYPFSSAGQYVSRSKWCDPNALWSLIDFGAHVGHCHEDTGHISLYAYGSDLLIDTGRYAYAWPIRAPFYQTSGHNTVMVDGNTQKRRDPLEVKWISTDQFDYVRGVHDNSEPLTHERTLVFRQPNEAGPGYWLCVDRLTGEGKHRLDQRWHTTEKMQAKAEGATVTITGKEGEDAQPSVVIANLPQEGLQAEVIEGAVSYAWYKKLPVDVAQFTLETEMPATFVTVLYPTPPGRAPARVRVERATTASADRTSVVVHINDGERQFADTWLVNHRPTDTEESRLTCLRTENGELTSWLTVEGHRIAHNGQLLFSAAEHVDGAGATLSARGTALACTEATDVRLLAGGKLTANGQPVAGPRDGEFVRLGALKPPGSAAVPRQPGPIRFEIEPPPPPKQASTVLEILDDDRAQTKLAVRMEAENFTGQGGGSVEISSTKKAASGKAFLHWDDEGHWLEWKATVPKAGKYQLLIRACTQELRALRSLTVNGKPVPGCEAMEFASTGGWSSETDDWETFVVTAPQGGALLLELPAGEVVIRLENVDGASLNLDWLGLIQEGSER